MADSTDEEMVMVPREVIRDAWVGLVPNLSHGEGRCNNGIPPFCFVCTALGSLRPYHHGGKGRLAHALALMNEDGGRPSTDAEVALAAEITRLRQGLWDVYAALGFDTDGDVSPDHLAAPDIVTLVLDAARETREEMEAGA